MRKKLYTVVLGICMVSALSACSALDLTPEPKSNGAAAEDVVYPTDAGTDAGTGNGTGNEATSTDPEPEPSRTAAPLVKAVQATIGTIVTTGRDLPLYRWDKDSADTSTCYDTCAQQFTAYPWTEDLVFAGVDRKHVGKLQRNDGTWQLTLNRQPVYTHVNDEPGTWKAQGRNDAWWLATPTGGKLTDRN
jgi:predicted lipoprotein with Yx(FWY)xxD motif